MGLETRQRPIINLVFDVMKAAEKVRQENVSTAADRPNNIVNLASRDDHHRPAEYFESWRNKNTNRERSATKVITRSRYTMTCCYQRIQNESADLTTKSVDS